MERLNLATKIRMLLVIFAVGIMVASISGIGVTVYVATERQIKEQMIVQTTKIVENYLQFNEGIIELVKTEKELELATTLRTFGVNLYIVDKEITPKIEYGVYRDFTNTQRETILPKNILANLTEQQVGKYQDIEIEGYGIFDVYTIPLLAKNELVGYLQLSKLNSTLPILWHTTLLTTLVMTPIIAILAYLIANQSVTFLLEPLKRLVKYLESENWVNSNYHEIVIPSTLDFETKTLTDSLNRMLGRLRQVLKEQSNIATEISHEFKTPLTRVTSNLQLMISENQMNKTSLKKTIREVVELGKCVDALLLLSQKNTGEESSWELGELIKEVIEGGDNIQRGEVKQESKVMLNYPRAQMKIVVRNLWENAIKYGDENHKIKLNLESQENSWSLVIENHKKIEKMQVGHGIGLLIVRRICDKHSFKFEIIDEKSTMTVIVSGQKAQV